MIGHLGWAAALAAGMALAACQGPDGRPEIDRGSFGAFARSLNAAPHGYRVNADATGRAPTPLLERFEVRAGDCLAERGWDDCSRGRERSELGPKAPDTLLGGRHWYGWSLYLPADFPDVGPVRVTLGRFYQLDAVAAWRFVQPADGYALERRVPGLAPIRYPLVGADDLRGRWHRIEVAAHWSPGADGRLQVFVDGTRRVDYAGPTATRPAYFTYGLTRTGVDAYAPGSPPAQTAYFANVRRARDRAGLAPAPPSG